MTERPNQRDLLSLKWDVMTDVLSLFFFFFFAKGWGKSAVLAYCQDSSLKTYQFPFTSEIGPQASYKAFYKVRMCNTYQER